MTFEELKAKLEKDRSDVKKQMEQAKSIFNSCASIEQYLEALLKSMDEEIKPPEEPKA